MAYGFSGMGGFPLGLPGMMKGTPAALAMLTPEDHVKDIQDRVSKDLEGRSELYKQAVYQYLYGIGHRIPSGDPHGNLLRIAKRESAS